MIFKSIFCSIEFISISRDLFVRKLLNQFAVVPVIPTSSNFLSSMLLLRQLKPRYIAVVVSSDSIAFIRYSTMLLIVVVDFPAQNHVVLEVSACF